MRIGLDRKSASAPRRKKLARMQNTPAGKRVTPEVFAEPVGEQRAQARGNSKQKPGSRGGERVAERGHRGCLPCDAWGYFAAPGAPSPIPGQVHWSISGLSTPFS